MAITDQPIRTFDLTSSESYMPGRAGRGSIVYLHGQSHGVLQAHTPEEMDSVRGRVRTALHEALRDNTLIVIGYSGNCDPVFDELAKEFLQFKHCLYWVHYDSGNPKPPEHLIEFLNTPGREAYLVVDEENEWMEADTALHRIVLDGLQLPLLPLVGDPMKHVKDALDRICGKPIERSDQPPTPNPVEQARSLVEQARLAIERAKESPHDSEQPGIDDGEPLKLDITLAEITGNRDELERLRAIVGKGNDSSLKRFLGNAFMRVAASTYVSDPEGAREMLERADELGTDEPYWLASTWGNLLSHQARTKRGSEADGLFSKAYAKYTEAVRIKPDMHEAYYNWGIALSAQAGTKRGSEADGLFKEAYAKYAEAVRIKPDKHEAYFNWGAALSAQAGTKSVSEADGLFKEAYAKYAEAVRLEPDLHEAYNNWGIALLAQAQTKRVSEADGLFKEAYAKFTQALRIKPNMHEAMFNLACLEATKNRVDACIGWLEEWRAHNPDPQRKMIEFDADFNAVRDEPAFIAFVESLPP